MQRNDFTRWWCLTIKRNERKEKIYTQSIVPLLQLIHDRDDQENITFKLKTVKTKFTH